MSRPTTLRGLPAALLTGLLAIACGPLGGTPSPTPGATPPPAPPSPTLPPVVRISSAAHAAALVFAHEHIGRMAPLLPGVIGQSAWYEATDAANGFTVTITVGAGDCQAGCIERHSWTYQVAHDGTITLVADEGDNVPIPPATGGAGPLALQMSLIAGPVCPVELNPPDPNCGPRPVVNAEVIVYDAAGQQVASGTSAADGSIALQLPPGAYYAVPQPVEGMLVQAAPLAFAGVGGDDVTLVFGYDTGIR
jgi:hypothetical protein